MTEKMIFSLSCLVVFLLLMQAEKFTWRKKSRDLQQVMQDQGSWPLLNKKYILLFILLGLFSGYWFSRHEHSQWINLPTLQNEKLVFLVILSVAAVFAGSISAKKIWLTGTFSPPFISPTASVCIALCRMLFLVAYEFFFRGVLLFSVAAVTGESISVAINVLLYLMAHGYSSRKVQIGAIPFGWMLCTITLWYQSVWPAVIIHLGLALSYETGLLINQKSSIKSIRL